MSNELNFKKNDNYLQEFFRVNNDLIYVKNKIKQIEKDLKQHEFYEQGAKNYLRIILPALSLFILSMPAIFIGTSDISMLLIFGVIPSITFLTSSELYIYNFKKSVKKAKDATLREIEAAKILENELSKELKEVRDKKDIKNKEYDNKNWVDNNFIEIDNHLNSCYAKDIKIKKKVLTKNKRTM